MKQEFRLVPWCISCAETCPHTLEEIGFSKKGLLARKCFILKKKKKPLQKSYFQPAFYLYSISRLLWYMLVRGRLW
jgi:hypothetical protein